MTMSKLDDRREQKAKAQHRASVLLGCGCIRCVRAWSAAAPLPGDACENGKAWIAKTAGMRPSEIIALGERKR